MRAFVVCVVVSGAVFGCNGSIEGDGTGGSGGDGSGAGSQTGSGTQSTGSQSTSGTQSTSATNGTGTAGTGSTTSTDAATTGTGMDPYAAIYAALDRIDLLADTPSGPCRSPANPRTLEAAWPCFHDAALPERARFYDRFAAEKSPAALTISAPSLLS